MTPFRKGLLAAMAAAILLIVGAMAVTSLGDYLNEGLGLRTAAMLSFGLTVAVLVVLLIAAGDGLIGEIQFVLPAFFLFFCFNFLLIAWVF
ncbi:hypothetical protein [Oricola cellulosilytica]|uniref:Uncharacterized protein n=1 Tax=Oricola cellulosilytica TaxID=1429082 RepID=A0A4R0PH42_9HYPH|nr:hypothetical protein [Oricola cellulosilytica]TCD14924.1 hypothetical protein E0D97_05040 [Oricola cellulosilytica]